MTKLPYYTEEKEENGEPESTPGSRGKSSVIGYGRRRSLICGECSPVIRMEMITSLQSKKMCFCCLNHDCGIGKVLLYVLCHPRKFYGATNIQKNILPKIQKYFFFKNSITTLKKNMMINNTLYWFTLA